ncbi:unnamed protein product, partial [marine sediment metagenome]
MKRLVFLLSILGLLAFSGTAFGWDFRAPILSSPTTVSAFSRTSSFTSSPTGFGSSGAIAFGCATCGSVTAITNTWSTTTTYDGWNGSISSAGASAFVSVLDGIVCEEPPVCDDGDEDGICDESDNCEFDPNTDQADGDEDGIGDACDECPDEALITFQFEGIITETDFPGVEVDDPITGFYTFDPTVSGTESGSPGNDITGYNFTSPDTIMKLKYGDVSLESNNFSIVISDSTVTTDIYSANMSIDGMHYTVFFPADDP